MKPYNKLTVLGELERNPLKVAAANKMMLFLFIEDAMGNVNDLTVAVLVPLDSPSARVAAQLRVGDWVKVTGRWGLDRWQTVTQERTRLVVKADVVELVEESRAPRGYTS